VTFEIVSGVPEFPATHEEQQQRSRQSSFLQAPGFATCGCKTSLLCGVVKEAALPQTREAMSLNRATSEIKQVSFSLF